MCYLQPYFQAETVIAIICILTLSLQTVKGVVTDYGV